jgi:hypothetical protein
MLAGVLTFAAAVQRPEELSTHKRRRVAAPLVHGMPFRMTSHTVHNETASRLRAVTSTTKLLTGDSAPSSSRDRQGQGDDNITAEEVLSERMTEEVWRGYAESNEEAYPVGGEQDAGSTDNKDDTELGHAADSEGAAMRTAGVTWALPLEASETSTMILTNNSVSQNSNVSQNSTDGASLLAPVR